MQSANGLPTPAPYVYPEIKSFWDATAEARLMLPRCNDCNSVIWYPRPFCPDCGSLNVSWFQASGRGTVYSFSINRRRQANHPAYRGADLYVLAYVQLEEGPRIMTNIVDCDPESVRIDQPVEAVFHDTGEGNALIRFKPAS